MLIALIILIFYIIIAIYIWKMPNGTIGKSNKFIEKILFPSFVIVALFATIKLYTKKGQINPTNIISKDDLINNFHILPEKITEYDYAEKTLDLNIFVGVNKIHNEYTKKINTLIQMDHWVKNGGFFAYWDMTDFSTSEGKDKDNKDINFLNSFLLELKLNNVSEFLITNNNYFIENYGKDIPENTDIKVNNLYTDYSKNNIKLQKALYLYCKDNLNKILGELD